MDKIVDNKRYFLYSSLPSELKAIYYNEIYKFLRRLVFEYYGFQEWYRGLFAVSYDLKCEREIIICEEKFSIAGIAIIKDGYDEKKICTLRVAKEFRNQGIGHQLVEFSFQLLNTEKPMITLHKSKFSQFEKLFDYYNFELEQTQRCYYNIFSTELVFNGALPQKDLLFNRIGKIDVEIFCKNFSLNTWSSEKYYNMCLHFLNQRELVRRLSILET